MTDIWGISTDLLEKSVAEQEERQESTGVLQSGIYPVTVEKAYLSKSQGGATAFNLDMVSDDGKKIFYTGWIRSGDEKGNKATYTDKNGNEVPLPSWFQVEHFLKAVGKKLEELKPVPAKMERFGRTEEILALPQLEGARCKAVVRQYENEYNGEVSIKYDIEDFLRLDGSRVGSKGRDEKAWAEFLAKNPIRKLRNKPAPKPEDGAKKEEAANAVLDAWG